MSNHQYNNFQNVKPGDWISIGQKQNRLDAVVCGFVDPAFISTDGDVEVVYLDYRGRAISTGVVWTGECWEFKNKGPSGGYADRNDRFQKYIDILRNGKF